MHNCGFCARYGRDLYFVSRDLTALSEQLKKYECRLGVVEVVGSNPAGPINKRPQGSDPVYCFRSKISGLRGQTLFTVFEAIHRSFQGLFVTWTGKALSQRDESITDAIRMR